MYRITDFRSPYVHYKCGCGRQFIEEEMYLCVKCAKGICRYCLEEEIDYFYCKHCHDVQQVNEAQAQKYKCQRLLQCPVCVSVLSLAMTHPKKDDPQKTKYYHYNCQHCQWNTLRINFKGENLNNLLIKFNYYKGQYNSSPQQIMYERLLEIYKFNQEEHIKMEKYMLRSKKKTIGISYQLGHKKQMKYLWQDFLDDTEVKDKQNETNSKKLVPFDDIYNKKVEKERAEKQRMSVYDTKSNLGVPARNTQSISVSDASDIYGTNSKPTLDGERTRTRTMVSASQSGFDADMIPDGLQTSKQSGVPRLSLEDSESGLRVQQPATTKNKRDSSGGSAGRRERLKNALNGGSDESGDEDKWEQIKDIPYSEIVDFMLIYDKSDAFSRKIIKKKVQRTVDSLNDSDSSLGSGHSFGSDDNIDVPDRSNSQSAFEGGSDDEKPVIDAPKGEGNFNFNSVRSDSSPEKEENEENVAKQKRNKKLTEAIKWKEIEEVSYPSLDEALDFKFELNSITGINQRLRNLNCQPRQIKELYPAPFQLLTKREKRCQDCKKIIIKPNTNPTSNEKMKADFVMIQYVPKVMIYRIGKYTHYKGLDQEIEMMLKIVNNDEQSPAKISFSKLDEENPQDGGDDDFVEEDKTQYILPQLARGPEIIKPDKVSKQMQINCDIDLPQGQVIVETKDIIDPAAQGNLITGNAEEKRSKEELLEACTEPKDIDFLYKIVANNLILKFPVMLKKGFELEKDEIKFGFCINYEMRINTQKKVIKVPIMVNTGKLKINTSGGNYVSSAQSVASAKKLTQVEKLEKGQAQMLLDNSFVSAASVKEKMDESFQSNVTGMTKQSNQSMSSAQSAAYRQAQINKQRQLDQMNASMSSNKSERRQPPK